MIRSDIRGSLRVADVRDKMREQPPRWLGRVMRRDEEEDVVWAIQSLRIEGRRGRRRPKLTWEQAIRADMRTLVIEKGP